jgi:hypothetical protein
MLTAIISTLVPTLSALVPASASGLLAEVIVADASSRDATAEVADIAGCRFMSSKDHVGARLRAAAATARSPWLMFLRAGVIPQPGWNAAADHFIQTGLSEGGACAAVFGPPGASNYLRPGFIALVRAMVARRLTPEQGLLIARHLYDEVGGHSARDDAEAVILRRLGRRRLVILPTAVTLTDS